MMLPILISVSVAPVSYFLSSAKAPLAARITRAAEKTPNRRWIAGILISLIWLNVSIVLDWELFSAPLLIQYHRRFPSKTKPPANGLRGASFSRTGAQEAVRRRTFVAVLNGRARRR